MVAFGESQLPTPGEPSDPIQLVSVGAGAAWGAAGAGAGAGAAGGAASAGEAAGASAAGAASPTQQSASATQQSAARRARRRARRPQQRARFAHSGSQTGWQAGSHAFSQAGWQASGSQAGWQHTAARRNSNRPRIRANRPTRAQPGSHAGSQAGCSHAGWHAGGAQGWSHGPALTAKAATTTILTAARLRMLRRFIVCSSSFESIHSNTRRHLTCNAHSPRDGLRGWDHPTGD